MLLSQEQLVQELYQQVFAVFLAEDSLNDQSENGLMYLAISLRFYVLAAKIRFSFVTSKKLTKKVFVGGRGEGDK